MLRIIEVLIVGIFLLFIFVNFIFVPYCFSKDVPKLEIKDSDNDGLSDMEEQKYGTNPLSNDTDEDGYTDEEEIATGYDPLVDDCAIEIGCDVSKRIDNPGKPVNVLLILDASGSMSGMIPDGNKMHIAKEAIKEHIEQLPESINVGLMVYGHVGSSLEDDRDLSCSNPEVLFPLQKLDKDKLKQVVDSFQPRGWTPIAGSLQKSKEVFDGKGGENNSILLVSDGMETCGGTPCVVAKDLKLSNIESRIDVVGFDVNTQAREQLECIAEVSDGWYKDANTMEEFKKIIKNTLDTIEEAVIHTECVIKHQNAWRKCVFKKSNTISAYRIRKVLDFKVKF